MINSRPPDVYFLHIPKTAGSSLGSLILQAYPQDQCLNCPWLEFLKMSREEINGFSAFAGHWGTALFSQLDREISSITMLRDPFERTVSAIKYAKEFDRSPELDLVGLRKIFDTGNFRDILNHDLLSKMLQDSQTLYLGYDVDMNHGRNHSAAPTDLPQSIPFLEYLFAQEISSSLDLNQMLIKAKQRLDTMAVVGLVEQFGDSSRLVCNFLGIGLPPTLPQQRRSAEKVALGRLTYRESGNFPDDVVQKIDDITVCDKELYEYGKKLFNQQLAKRRRRFFWLPKVLPSVKTEKE